MKSIASLHAVRAVTLCGLLVGTGGGAIAAGTPDIQRMDPAAALGEPDRYPPEMVERPGSNADFDGSFRHATTYRSADGRFVVSLWQSGPGTLKTDAYPHDEYCRVLEGRVIITNRSGSRAEYGVGDTFVIPKVWAGTWDMPVRFTKQFVAMER